MQLEQLASHHASAIVLGTHGVLITGPSGAGKSELARTAVSRWQDRFRHASWIGDDRVRLAVRGSMLIASACAPISGMAEHRYRGVDVVPFQSRAVIDLVVALEPIEKLERCPEPETLNLAGVEISVPVVGVPRRDPVRAMDLFCSYLKE